ncbi:MAG: ABC transporter permease [Clostridia bacterium]|nr:ABC transporter permease [Clostridia bacterium]
MVNKNKIVFMVLFGLIWELIVQLEIYPVALMPSIFQVIESFYKHRLDLFQGTTYSLWMITKGLGLSFLIMILFVFLSSRYKIWRDWIDLWTKLLHPIPGVALLPLVVLWFGISNEAVMVIMIHAALWPMFINVHMEYEKIHREYKEVIKAYKLSFLKKVTKVYLPGCLPGIVTGLRIGWHRAWRAFISAEMIYSVMGNHSGLGWFIFERRVYMDTAGLLAGILVIMFCSILIESFVFDAIERRTIKKWAV